MDHDGELGDVRGTSLRQRGHNDLVRTVRRQRNVLVRLVRLGEGGTQLLGNIAQPDEGKDSAKHTRKVGTYRFHAFEQSLSNLGMLQKNEFAI